ncbi:nuclear transport factor 2 family protein [Variovorax sp.]|uniref:nuclear transport factor 2 family protein n=1 Tax=Variovorax sp. TaxID=1871043 RepID=UPI00138300B7|nr:nuclear transport factor 2 family protein [Variovorax sp.]KAF1066267.1 MAG: hypothetical protein GAK39_05035 [Variovorax sp.]
MPSKTEPTLHQAAIAELIQRWAFCRDNARWAALTDCFTPAGDIAVSWFRGRHVDFVEASRRLQGRSFNRHRMLGTLCEVEGERAWAESAVMMIGFGSLDGTPVRWECHFRFIDLLAQEEGAWRLARRTAVYDMDSLVADAEGATLALDAKRLSRLPRPYRYLGYRLLQAGHEVPLDLPTADSEAERELREQARAWLRRP